MMKDNSYAAIMARKNEIIRNSVGMDYESFEKPGIGFDYEAMMAATGYTLPELQRVQALFSVGNTPLIELRNLTALARKCAPAGKGARIFIKDEATNPSGSFKARRSCTSVYQAKKLGYKGVVTATSGNYGAAVACHAAMAGLKCIVVQECYDSRGVGQPEIIEKARKCEALGAEVVQLTVGPELFSTVLRLLEETGYFNASLYTPFGIAGVETLVMKLLSSSVQSLIVIPMLLSAPMRAAAISPALHAVCAKPTVMQKLSVQASTSPACTWQAMLSSTKRVSQPGTQASAFRSA